MASQSAKPGVETFPELSQLASLKSEASERRYQPTRRCSLGFSGDGADFSLSLWERARVRAISLPHDTVPSLARLAFEFVSDFGFRVSNFCTEPRL